METFVKRQPLHRVRPSNGFAALRLREVWEARDLLVVLAQRDVKLRYKQTALGIIWVVLQPLLAAGIFSFVFGFVAKMPSEGKSYFLFSYAGLLGWTLFNNTVTRASGCLVGNSQLVSKIFFPRLVLPLATIPSALLDFAVALVMMGVLMVLYRAAPGVAALLLPLWILLILMVSAGIGFWTSALTVSYRDIQYILPVVLQLLLYGSPIAYAASTVPVQYRWLYELNPLVSIFEGLRWSLLNTAPPHTWAAIYSTVMALVIVVGGAFAFKRMERKFADVI